MNMKLYDAAGNIEAVSDFTEFGEMPDGALALKYADEVDDGRWVTDQDDMAQLIRADAPLSFTMAGLEYCDCLAEELAIGEIMDWARAREYMRERRQNANTNA